MTTTTAPVKAPRELLSPLAYCFLSDAAQRLHLDVALTRAHRIIAHLPLDVRCALYYKLARTDNSDYALHLRYMRVVDIVNEAETAIRSVKR